MDQHCAASNLPDFETRTPNTLPRGIQAIIPMYQFTCSGTVTKWYAKVQGAMPSRIDFQIWRMVGQGYFQLVGGNTGPMERMRRHSKEVFFDVPSHLRVHVQPGDIVGLYVGSEEGDMKIMYKEDFRVVTYVKNHVVGPLGGFPNDPLFATPILGAPIIDMEVERGMLYSIEWFLVVMRNEAKLYCMAKLQASSGIYMYIYN